MDKRENIYKTVDSSARPASADAYVKELVSETTGGQIGSRSLSEMRQVHLDSQVDFKAERKERKKQRTKRSNRLNAKQQRELRLYEIEKEAHQYALFEQLHTLWEGYMAELYNMGPNPSLFAQKLLKADYHGAILKVVQSSNPSYVGLTGIVVKETLYTFVLITRENRLLRIPKQHAHFEMTVEACHGKFTLYGPQLVARPFARANKKFKPQPSTEL
ncbi:Rof/RNase P-like protein [Syncephalastrum racemosum]|uniref:Rof/RNase P-like protein n=1 Tax=Syncephalastrum racemosum TaxID=13706 RepID=A0A1X2H9K7_SYNRA|nr:Rof/RNase P-like protein [Syncephalastrum racemosum]